MSEKKRTILLVDNDKASLVEMASTLTEAGFRIFSASSLSEAMELAAKKEPSIIIAEIAVPDLDGLELQKVYFERFVFRLTPFIFLSSVNDPAIIVRGLENGAFDVLVKPVHPAVLKAKVRRWLEIREQIQLASYGGSFEGNQFARVLNFCRRRKLNGLLVVTSSTETVHLKLIKGEAEELASDPALMDRIYGMSRGRFWIMLQVSRELAGKVIRSVSALGSAQQRGFLSSLKVGGKLYEIQTELLVKPEPRIQSSVFIKGQLLDNQDDPIDLPITINDLESKILRLHRKVEAKVRKEGEARGKKAVREIIDGSLFETGFDAFEAGDYPKAIAVWSEALRKKPTSQFLTIHIQLARQRLGDTANQRAEKQGKIGL